MSIYLNNYKMQINILKLKFYIKLNDNKEPTIFTKKH